MTQEQTNIATVRAFFAAFESSATQSEVATSTARTSSGKSFRTRFFRTVLVAV